MTTNSLGTFFTSLGTIFNTTEDVYKLTTTTGDPSDTTGDQLEVNHDSRTADNVVAGTDGSYCSAEALEKATHKVDAFVTNGKKVYKVEEVYTKGTHGTLDADDKEVCKAREMDEGDDGEYKPTDSIEYFYASDLKPFDVNDTKAVGVVLKFNNGFGEVVYRTEESYVVRSIGKDGKLMSSRESFAVYDYYENEAEELMATEAVDYKFDTLSFHKAANGELYVYGVYSSHYIDSDKDILTGEAHKYFADGVNDGVFEYPELRIAHLPVTVGKCEMVDYDDGFAVFGGKIFKEWVDPVEEIIKGSKEHDIDLGQSHGFLRSTIEYDSDGYITKYASHEISILPINKQMKTKSGEVVDIINASNIYTALLSEEK